MRRLTLYTTIGIGLASATSRKYVSSASVDKALAQYDGGSNSPQPAPASPASLASCMVSAVLWAEMPATIG